MVSSFLSLSYSCGQMVAEARATFWFLRYQSASSGLSLFPGWLISLGILRAVDQPCFLRLNFCAMWKLHGSCKSSFDLALEVIFFSSVWQRPPDLTIYFLTPRVGDVESTSQWWNDLCLQRWPPKMTVVTSYHKLPLAPKHVMLLLMVGAGKSVE